MRIMDWSSDVCSSDLIHPAQQYTFFEGVGLEHAFEETLQAILQGAELLRETVDQVAPRRVALLLQAFHQTVVEALLKAGEFALQMRQRAVVALAIVQGEGHAPDLGALFLAQAVARSEERGVGKGGVGTG